MNNVKSFILRIILFPICFTCKANLFGQIISGNIAHGSGDQVIKFNYSDGLVSKDDSVKITDKGTFTRKFSFPEAKYLLITYNSFRKQIYIFPFAKIKISFDATDDSTFRKSFMISGDYHINDYLNFITKNQFHYKYIYDKVKIDQPVDSFRQVLKSFSIFSDSLRSSFFKKFYQTKNITPLNNFIKTDSINWYAYSILSANDYLGIIHTGNKDLFWKEEIEKKVIAGSSNTYLIADFYRRLWFFFLKGAFTAKLKGADSTQVRKTGFTTFSIEYIRATNVEGKLKELIVSQLLTDLLGLYTYETLEQNKVSDSLIVNLKQQINDKAFIEEFDRQYIAKKKIQFTHLLGQRAPDFTLVDTTGHIYTLNDFKGKVILIDVWASWCGPCIKEFPFLNQLEQKLKDNKNFQLLSVSTDDTKQLWLKNGVLKFKPPGLGLWVGKEKEFNRAYNIDLIPLLVLLDKEGKFIDFNPPRASEGDKLYVQILEKL